MPIVEQTVAMLAGHRYFTTLDLMAGYYQILIDEPSKMFTGFSTNDGHYEFNRMPFDLANERRVFQDMMNTMAHGKWILEKLCRISISVAQGLERLRKLFKLLRGNMGYRSHYQMCVLDRGNEVFYL